MAKDDKESGGFGFGFGLEDALKIGAGVALGVAAVKLVGSGAAAPKSKSGASEGSADMTPLRRPRHKKRRKAAAQAPGSKPIRKGVYMSDDLGTEPRVQKKKVSPPSAYSKFVQAEMPKYQSRGYSAQQSMSEIAAAWRKKNGK